MFTTKKVRVRFAPSPTGGLHLGGVRTVLFNYLFAKQHKGDFVLRIEDTDQNRLVAGAEEYITQCLNWCELQPDESPYAGGSFAPYRQSERKNIYQKYAEQLVLQGYAYYAFDTVEALEAMRSTCKTAENPSPQYNHSVRMKMRNSLTLPPHEVQQLLNAKTPYVIRIKIPAAQTISFIDMIRGEVNFHTDVVDDKVLLKADGMPTYHLAVVVDDYLMKITHAFRGEEWLPSSPVHILLWKYLGWEKHMPQWAHLPLILKPDGKGKLSKRDGDRLGFPVFAMNWTDAKTNELTKGFKEMGFLPQAFINMLAVMGWNDGTEQEVFTIKELIERFDISRVHKGGAKFSYEKAKWFNHEWIKRLSAKDLLPHIQPQLQLHNITNVADAYTMQIIDLVKDRCTLLTDFWDQSFYFFKAPTQVDISTIKAKWSKEKKDYFISLINQWSVIIDWNTATLEQLSKTLLANTNLKAGDILLPLRIMLVGTKSGPAVFDIAAALGKTETINRIASTLQKV